MVVDNALPTYDAFMIIISNRPWADMWMLLEENYMCSLLSYMFAGVTWLLLFNSCSAS